MIRRRAEVVEARPFGIRRSNLRGAQMLVAGVPVTPVVRRVMVWWPGGGGVYARAHAIEYLDGSRTQQIRIAPIQSLAFGGLIALGAAAIAASIALRWKKRL